MTGGTKKDQKKNEIKNQLNDQFKIDSKKNYFKIKK